MLPWRRALFGGVPILGAASASFATFDPANKSADITLSNGNRTAARTTAASGTTARAISTGGKTAGKWHAEFTIVQTAGTNPNYPGIGVCNINFGTDGGGVGNVTGAIYLGSGGITVDGSFSGGQGSFTGGDIIAVELDATSGQIYFERFGGTGRKGPFAISTATALALMMETTTDNSPFPSVTVNAGQSAFAITPTSGFSGWSA